MHTCRCDGVPLLFCPFIALLLPVGFKAYAHTAPPRILSVVSYSLATRRTGCRIRTQEVRPRPPDAPRLGRLQVHFAPWNRSVITDGDWYWLKPARLSTTSWTSIRSRHCGQTRVRSNRSRHLFWFHASQGSLVPLMLMEAILNIALTRVPGIIRMVLKPVVQKIREGFTKPRTEAVLRLAEEHLSTADFFSGDRLRCCRHCHVLPIGGRTRSWLSR